MSDDAKERVRGFFTAHAGNCARDPSHARALSPGEWRELAGGAGLRVLTLDVLPDRMAWERWLSPVAAGGPEDALARERLAAAPRAVGAEVVESDGRNLFFLEARVVLSAVRPG